MPAYRSDAEAEIRDAVVARLRRSRPDSRIMHEVNICDGSTRADVLCVGRDEIIAVEIKSERDKLDRLSGQIADMQRSAHICIAAMHRRFMPEIRDTSRPRVEGLPWTVQQWWYPKAQDMAEAQHRAFDWPEPDRRDSLGRPLPPDALLIPHRDELEKMCHEIGISVPPRSNMAYMQNALRWGATGRQITLAICAALRRRSLCAESDDPIKDEKGGA